MGARLTDRERELRKWSEKELQAEIRRLAETFGWRYMHIHDSRRMVRRGDHSFLVGDKDASGFPDTCLVKPPRVIMWELKKQGPPSQASPTPEQVEWLEAFDACGIEARVVRPGDLEDYVIPTLAGKLTPKRSKR